MINKLLGRKKVGTLSLLPKVHIQSVDRGEVVLPSVSANSVLTDYDTNPVGKTSAITLFNCVPHVVRAVRIFDSSGLPMVLIITSGANTAFITTYFIPPGGDNPALKISKGDKIQLLAYDATANSGLNILTLLY